MSQITIEHDTDYNNTTNGIDRDVLDRIVEHGGTLVFYQYHGPAGGNPRFGIEFPDRETAREYLSDVYEDTFVDDDLDLYVRPNDSFNFDFSRVHAA